jgi:CRISPR/Cas system-associated protein Csm6
MKKFIELLHEPVLATTKQQLEEIWDVEGRLKNGNQSFKFDIRPLKPRENKLEKTGYFKSKSDKMVFETIDQWVIFDTEELNEYVKSADKRDFNIEELLDNLSWNLILHKVE